jgi:16S rRNA (cytosine967-C5)-methyltransferase
VYSTCTNLREENGNVVTAFLREHPEFALESMRNLPDNEGMLQFTPDEEGNDGFFVARMRKIK